MRRNPASGRELYNRATTETSPEFDRRKVSCIWLPRRKLTDSIQYNIRHRQSYDTVRRKATLLQCGSGNHRGRGRRIGHSGADHGTLGDKPGCKVPKRDASYRWPLGVWNRSIRVSPRYAPRVLHVFLTGGHVSLFHTCHKFCAACRMGCNRGVRLYAPLI